MKSTNNQDPLPFLRLVVTATFLLLLSVCNPVKAEGVEGFSSLTPKPPFKVQLISREVAIWLAERDYAEELERQASEQKLDVNQKTLARARSIATRLIQQATNMYPASRSWDWDLHVVEVEEFNANCRDGGKMIINSFFLQPGRFDNHQIATVIGHEIAHALLEHTRSMRGRAVLSVGGGVVMAQSFKMGRVRSMQVINGIQKLTLPIDREAERQADLLGLTLMAKAGFDPVKGVKIWELMTNFPEVSRVSNRLELYESDHPTSDERLALLTKAASQLVQTKAANK